MFFRGFLITALLFVSLTVWSQSTLAGEIIDASGNPMPGVNVFLVDLKKGDATDENGRFKITDVKDGNYTLRVSFVGYQTINKAVTVDGSSSSINLNIEMSRKALAFDELVVSATRATASTPVTFQNLDKEEIEEANLGQDVPFLLRWTPSAVVTSDAGTGIGYTGIRIRGTDPTRINVTINGIPLNDAESQGVFWVNLPDFLSSANSIQIQRGVGTSTNGAGAFGATINLNTFQPREDAYVALGGTIGSFNTWKTNVQLGTGLLNDRFIFTGRLSTIQSDGFIDRASADLNSFALSGTYLGDKSSLQFNLFSGHEITYQAWYGVPAAFLDDEETRTFNPSGTEKEGEPHDNEVDDYRQTHYQLLFNSQLNENWNLSLNGHYTKGSGFFEQYKADQLLADYGISSAEPFSNTDLIRRLWLDNDFYGATYSLSYNPQSSRLNFVLGGGYNIYEGGHFGEVIWARQAGDSELGDRYYENDARKTDFNIYGKLNYGLTEKLNAFLDLQYRTIDYTFLGRDNELNIVDQDVSLNFFNPKFGFVYNLSEKSSLYTSVAVGQREPNRNDFVASTPNNRPRAEKLTDYELGWRLNGSRGGFEANIYYMDYKDQLAPNGQLNQVGEAIRINIDDSYRLGLELSGAFALSDRFMVEGNTTISQNKINQFTEFVDSYDANFNFINQEQILRENTDLAFSPNVIAGGGLTYKVFEDIKNGQLSASLLTKYVGQQFIDNTSDENNVLEAYSFTDFRLKYQLSPKWMKRLELTFIARNIFDQLFETNAWSYRYFFDGVQTVDQGFFPQAGTNFLAGIRLEF